ncbi:MAG TPA: ABC transporter substrate-binding protein [Acidimicrobiales bacterium]|nr:ABC transporter substrate-binding protein [Acidimicrobiales bacterium]
MLAALIGAGLAGLTSGAAGASTVKKSGGGKLTVALSEPPISLNAFGPNDADPDTFEINKQVFNALVDPGKKPGTYVPDLATRWVRQGPNTWRFTLNTKIRFANGKHVSAQDVVADLDTLTKSGTALSALWTSFASASAAGPRVVVIRTTQPMGTMLDALSLLPIVPAADVKNTSYWNKPFGTGPFEVTNFVPDQSVTLKPNPRYAGRRPAITSLDFVSITNPADLTSYVKSGQVDVVLQAPPSQASQLSGHGIKVAIVPSYSYDFVWFNCSKPPFSNQLVRQAMLYALPLRQIIRSIWGKYGTIGTAPIPSTIFGYSRQTPYPYDPAKAKQLLARAGYPNGFSTSLMWESGMAPNLDTMAAAFTSAWSQIGVHVQLQPLPPATWLSNLDSLNFSMDLQSNTDVTGDADYTLGRLYTATADRFGFKNAYLTSLLEDARSSVNPALRKKLYARAISFIWKEALGVFPVQTNSIFVWRDTVRGVTFPPSGIVSFASASVQK